MKYGEKEYFDFFNHDNSELERGEKKSKLEGKTFVELTPGSNFNEDENNIFLRISYLVNDDGFLEVSYFNMDETVSGTITYSAEEESVQIDSNNDLMSDYNQMEIFLSVYYDMFGNEPIKSDKTSSAFKILKYFFSKKDFEWLGEGSTSEIFTDGDLVYKVIISKSGVADEELQAENGNDNFMDELSIHDGLAPKIYKDKSFSPLDEGGRKIAHVIVMERIHFENQSIFDLELYSFFDQFMQIYNIMLADMIYPGDVEFVQEKGTNQIRVIDLEGFYKPEEGDFNLDKMREYLFGSLHMSSNFCAAVVRELYKDADITFGAESQTGTNFVLENGSEKIGRVYHDKILDENNNFYSPLEAFSILINSVKVFIDDQEVPLNLGKMKFVKMRLLLKEYLTSFTT